MAYSRDGILSLDRGQVAFLREAAAKSPLGRARICAHHSPGEPLHEMLIVVERRSYLRPHRHIAKPESFHMIEGEMDVVIFGDEGAIEQVIPMSTYGGPGSFYYRLSESRFHTLLLRSDWVLFQETTTGPFDPSATVRASWAPAEDAPARDIDAFRARMESAAAGCRRERA